MHRGSLLLAIAFTTLPACLAHERTADVDAAIPGNDAATLVDAVSPAPDAFAIDAGPPVEDAGRCTPATPTALRFEPALPMPANGIRIVWLGYDDEPAEDGARIHLDTCGGSPPCPLDLVVPHVGNALASIRGATGIGGTLDTDGGSYAVVHLEDLRRCATCGGRLELLAGRLVSGLDADIFVGTEGVACSTGCGELRVTTAHAFDFVARATAGAPVVGPLLVSVASDYHAPCVVCDCAAADVPATGVIAWSSGIFVPAP